MLGSITPLGERSRGMNWTVTFAAFTVGAVAAGALMGGVLGSAGSLVGPTAAAPAVLAGGLAVGLALDLRARGRALPGPRRQVDERWLHRYRGWVYGVAFGFQLGAGVLTVVTTSAVYLTLLAAALSASPWLGAAIGALLGATRAATLLPARRITSPAGLVAVDGRLRRLQEPVRRVTLAALAALLAASLALTVL